MSKKVTKKLELNKQTVIKLDEKKMNEVQGGVWKQTNRSCNDWCDSFSCYGWCH